MRRLNFSPRLLCLAPLLALNAALSFATDPAITRVAFLDLIDRPRVPLAAVLQELGVLDGLKVRHFTFATEVGQRVPGLWYQAADASGPRPVVIILHGTDGAKDGMKNLLETYAHAGFIAVAIDGRYHGARTKSGQGRAEYQDAILRAWRAPGREHPFFYDTVWDVMRLVDYLASRDEVDAKRIGLIGISKGGIETYLAAAADPRIAVAVPCIGVQSFRWALEHNAWQSRIGTIQAAVDDAAKEAGVAQLDAAFIRQFYERVAPGIDGEFDGPAMLPLIAPRPLLVINGDSDARTPLLGVQLCLDAARPLYHAANADERLKFIAELGTAHDVTPESHQAALEWFKLCLKP
ncbi:MAG: alpha/beta hydrolase [Opitutaceae bacterium]|nr:alpha/beta hydrolase [Opitutaceae bacterium]